MSYPDPVYFGDDGQVSARLVAADAPPTIDGMPRSTCTYLATGESTGGRFGLYKWQFGPAVSGPDPHFHRTIAESFYVLDGVVSIHDGLAWQDRVAGDFVYVPEGGIHGFKNTSGAPASMLLLFAPGAPREEYFETLAELAQGREMTPEDREDFMLRHDNVWV